MDDREYLIILMQRALKGLKYVSQSIIQLDQEIREFLAKKLASKHGEGSSSVSHHVGNKIGESIFSKTLTHVGYLKTRKPSRKEISCSTSQSKGKEKRTKSEDSLEPSVHGFFERLFGFPQREINLFSASMRMMSHQILHEKETKKIHAQLKIQ